MDNDEIFMVIEGVRNHIKECSILSQILNDKIEHPDIDYNKYISLGYTQEEISVGAQLIELFLILDELQDSQDSSA